MKVDEMKQTIKRYEDALKTIIVISEDEMTADVARAALGNNKDFEVIPQEFQREV